MENNKYPRYNTIAQAYSRLEKGVFFKLTKNNYEGIPVEPGNKICDPIFKVD